MPFRELKTQKAREGQLQRERTGDNMQHHPRPYTNKIQNKISKQVKGKTNSRRGFL